MCGAYRRCLWTHFRVRARLSFSIPLVYTTSAVWWHATLSLTQGDIILDVPG